MKLKKLFASLILLTSLSACNVSKEVALGRLTTPKVQKVAYANYVNMSDKTYSSYLSFAKKFTYLMMQVNNNDCSNSLGISIPDAYLCLAIMGAISSDVARDDVLKYLGLQDMDELRTAVKEVVSTLCTLYENFDHKLRGGYNLNSIWLNPYKVYLKDKDEQLYQDLEEIFDASIFLEELTSDKANQYMKDNGLKDLPTPEIKLNDDDPSALNVMSAYYCLDYFSKEQKDIYLSQYQSGNHKMDYHLGENTLKVDYIEQTNSAVVYEGENFYGSSLSIGLLDMALFLPNDRNVLPNAILKDVLIENYHEKDSFMTDFSGNTYPTKIHDVHISAPYFYLDNKAELTNDILKLILPIISTHGAGERLVSENNGNSLFLDYIKQFSVMKFNYDGFYSCSVTIAGADATSTGIEYQSFDLTLDHPYIFEVRKMISLENNKFVHLPIVIGEIVNPDYK